MIFHRGFCADVRLYLDTVFREALPANRLFPRTPAESLVCPFCARRNMLPLFWLACSVTRAKRCLASQNFSFKRPMGSYLFPCSPKVATAVLHCCSFTATNTTSIIWHRWRCDRHPFINILNNINISVEKKKTAKNVILNASLWF